MPYCGAISCPPLRSVQSSGPEFIKLEMFISCTTVLQLIYQKNDPVHLLLDLTLGVRARAAGHGEMLRLRSQQHFIWFYVTEYKTPMDENTNGLLR